jgi:hypothetical protein
MVYFHNKNSNFGIFWRVLEWIMLKHSEYFTAIWYIIRPFGIYYGHLVYFTAIWYILWPFGICNMRVFCISPPRFGILRQEKSGSPGCQRRLKLHVLSIQPIEYITKHKKVILCALAETRMGWSIS